MPRNLDKRVEITFPVEDEILKQEVINILTLQLSDTLKAHILQPNGREYEKQDLRGMVKIAAQDEFCRLAMQKQGTVNRADVKTVFEPATGNA